MAGTPRETAEKLVAGFKDFIFESPHYRGQVIAEVVDLLTGTDEEAVLGSISFLSAEQVEFIIDAIKEQVQAKFLEL